MDRFFDLSLKVFGDKHWDADKEMLAHAAMGLIKVSLEELLHCVWFVLIMSAACI